MWSIYGILVFTIAVAAVGADDTTTPASVGPHGSNCTTDANCDISIGLACIKEKCECSRPKEMVYDQNKTACIVLASYSCDNTTGLKYESYNCTKNSQCILKPGPSNVQTKVCTCNSGFSFTGDKKCMGDFDTPCDPEKEPCNSDAMLICQVAPNATAWKCGCNKPNETLFENGKCVTLAGRICTINTPPYILDCVSGATCEMKNSPATKGTTGVCECKKGTVALKNGRCSSVSQILGSLFLTATLAMLCLQYTQFMSK